MTVKTHIVSSLVLGIAIANLIDILGSFYDMNVFYLYISAVVLGATFPDIDEPNSYIGRKLPLFSNLLSVFVSHRGITHTLLLLSIYIFVVFTYIIDPVYKIIGIGFIVGNIGHILGDMTTRSGVALFYPLYSENIGLLPKSFRFYTGGFTEYAIVLPAFSLVLFYQLYVISLTL